MNDDLRLAGAIVATVVLVIAVVLGGAEAAAWWDCYKTGATIDRPVTWNLSGCYVELPDGKRIPYDRWIHVN